MIYYSQPCSSGNLIVHGREYTFDLLCTQKCKNSEEGIHGGPIVYLAARDAYGNIVLLYDREWKKSPDGDEAKEQILKLILLEFGGGKNE